MLDVKAMPACRQRCQASHVSLTSADLHIVDVVERQALRIRVLVPRAVVFDLFGTD